MLELSHVSFGYGSESTVHDVSLSVAKGKFVALLGSNGAGKSTLSKLVRGLLRPTTGSVVIDGIDTKKVKASALASKIGFLFQNPDRQICKNTVGEELTFSLTHAGIDAARGKERLTRTLEVFALDPEAAPFSLSRGERQRVALASVLVSEPDLLILDEPTTGLDYKECIQIMDYVKELNQKGVTVLMVTHDMEIALDYASRVVLMHDGRVVADGKPEEIFYDEAAMAAASLLPPQIIGLSLALDGRLGRVTTVDEMTDAIRVRVGKGTAGQ